MSNIQNEKRRLMQQGLSHEELDLIIAQKYGYFTADLNDRIKQDNLYLQNETLKHLQPSTLTTAPQEYNVAKVLPPLETHVITEKKVIFEKIVIKK